jgi:hypothetical protein
MLALADPGDTRRHDRLVELLGSLAARPGRSLPEQCAGPAPLKAAYRLLNCPALCPVELMHSARAATVEKLHKLSPARVILAIQDTTTLNFTTHEAMAGRGRLSNNSKTMGFFAHSTLVMTEDTMVHGLLESEIYARDTAAQKARASGARNRQQAAEKESGRWLRGVQQAAALCEELPEAPAVVAITDREGDMYELFCEVRVLQESQPRLHVLIRAQHDRELAGAEQRLWDHLAAAPAQQCWELHLPRARGVEGRQTRRVEALWQRVRMAPPAHQRKYQGSEEPLVLTVIIVREPAPPPGAEPLEWVLHTTWPVADPADLRRVVEWYAQRWQIEVLHRIWKSGCKVEERRFQDARAAQAMIILDLLVAARLLELLTLSRQEPERSAETWLSAAEQAVLRWRFAPASAAAGPPLPLTISRALRWIAQLGGYRGSPSSPPPGAEMLWRGLANLNNMVAGWLCAQQAALSTKCG